jgi:hypothetical protein
MRQAVHLREQSEFVRGLVYLMHCLCLCLKEKKKLMMGFLV